MKANYIGFIKHSKINIIIDGQFGSTGKGLIAEKIAKTEEIDISIGCLSPNAGHSFYLDGQKQVTRCFPVSGILQENSLIYLSANSVIDEDLLFDEIKRFNIDPARIIIHPRASVITKEIKEKEKDSNYIKISSTQSGTGKARSSKIERTNPLVQNTESLRQFIQLFDLESFIADNRCLVETSQGVDLGLNFGLSYPYCTSRDVLPSCILAELGLHPMYLGNIMLTFRTYPIRVGNMYDDKGKLIGYSGPVYPNSIELTWDDLKQKEEYTSVTNKVRRVFTFSKHQYHRSIRLVKPTHIFLNFCNYIRPEDYELFKSLNPTPNYFGYSSNIDDIYTTLK